MKVLVNLSPWRVGNYRCKIWDLLWKNMMQDNSYIGILKLLTFIKKLITSNSKFIR